MTIVEQVQQQLGRPAEAACQELGVPYSTLMRWRKRREAGQAMARRPGPAKVEALNLTELEADIRGLTNGRERTRGTGALYERYRMQVSRRDLQAMVEAARRELHREQQALERRIEWRVPGLVWSMDDTKKHWLAQGFGHVHVVMDLASRYQLRVLGDDEQANGMRVAMNLAELFHQYGAPLFMKMDGGSNFKHHAVRTVLGEAMVIPLISPPHYPPYNGSVERSHQEMLRAVAAGLSGPGVPARELRLVSALSAHELNHRRRRSLGGRMACHALHIGRPLLRLFGRRERKEVFDELNALAVDIAQQLDQHTNAARETAFRYAVETWLQANSMIRITRNGQVLPPFYRFSSH